MYSNSKQHQFNLLAFVLSFLIIVFFGLVLFPNNAGAQECSETISCDDIYDSPREIYSCDSSGDVVVEFQEIYCASGICRWRIVPPKQTIPCGIEKSCENGKCESSPPPPPPPPNDDNGYSTHTIIVETVGNGSGLVTAPRANQGGSNPSQSGINCHSSGSPNNCSDERESRSNSTTWNLTASADAGSEFVGWNIPAHSMGTQCGENSSCRVRVSGNWSQTTVRARFQVSATGPTLSCQVVSENQINLSWTSVPPTAGGTTEYTVFRCTGAGCNPSVGVHTTTGTGWGNTGRVADTTYGYLVGARPAPGVALPSDPVYCTTSSQTPTPPTLSCQAVSENQINLSWTPTSPTSPGGTTEYRVSRCVGSGCNPTAGVHNTTATSWNDTGRTAGSTSGYKVTARPGTGELPSNTVYCTTLPPDHINDDINDDPNDAPPPPPPPCVCSWGNCVTSGPCVGTGCGWTGTRTGTETYICTSGVNCPGEGNTRSCSVSCNLGPCPEIDNFWVEPSSWVKRGEERTINWETSNVTSCTLRREPPTPPIRFPNLPVDIQGRGYYDTGPMEFVTKFTLTCSRLNNYGVEVTTDPETLFIRILPVFKEV